MFYLLLQFLNLLPSNSSHSVIFALFLIFLSLLFNQYFLFNCKQLAFPLTFNFILMNFKKFLILIFS